MRAEIRNAKLKQRMDARSRWVTQLPALPMQILTMKPWWELRQIREEQDAERAALPKPVLQPMRRTRIQPVMPSSGMVARAKRMFGIGMPSYA